ncbi:MAG: primosomal protein N' [bacterium]
MDTKTQIAKVVVDIALDREFDYRVPEPLRGQVLIGSAVLVPFGRSRRSGYVVGFAEGSERADVKDIMEVTGTVPLLSADIVKLARWIGDYYCAPVEHAIRAVLPGAVRRKGAKFKECLFVFPVRCDGQAHGPDIGELLKRSPGQAAALGLLGATADGIALAELARRAGVGVSAIRALEKKGLVRIEPSAVGRNPFMGRTVLPTSPRDPTPEQASALSLIRRSLDTVSPPVVLLNGVTGSGKTEVYLQAIAHALDGGKGAAVLVPEIALTPQTVERFRGRFGDNIAVLHSQLSDGERHDEWHRIREGKARIAIGARSAVFAPVRNLGLIVVDEEHDTSYKQDESPRYNARDVAVMRGRMEHCSVLLGSATPSFESFYNAQTGKYAMVRLTKRVDDRKMPAIRVVDMRIEADRVGRPNIFSRDLVTAMGLRLDKGEQTILFLNRRGFSTSLQCPKCGYVARCPLCSIAYTYHRVAEGLRCHVCGGARRVPEKCPDCGDPAFKFSGMGTQRIEGIVSKLFPKARVRRMDSDAMGGKLSYEEVLDDFRTGKIDILVGTQMIAKGLDFPNVTLIGIIYADLSLYVSDFRAGERTFQLLTQVAGRAGRGDVPGEVLVQTYTPMAPAIRSAVAMDYVGFYEKECLERRELQYPPFSRLVCITARGPSDERVVVGMRELCERIRRVMPESVTMRGPSPAPLAKAKGLFRHQLMLRSRVVSTITTPLRDVLKEFQWPSKVACSVDVDAISLI